MTDQTLTMLADAAAAFAKPDPSRVRKWRATPPGFDRSTWLRMAEQGWLSALVPEELDGLGLGVTAATVIAERLGHALYTEPYVPAGLMAPVCLVACEPGAQVRELLAGVLSGKTIASIAWQSERGGLDIDQTAVVANREADRVSLSGASHFVPVASAEVFIVAARCAGELALYRVGRDCAGLVCESHMLADGCAIATLRATDVRLPDSACIARGERADASLRHAIDCGIVVASAELVGVMERCLDMTLEYLRTRKQFGRAIGSFQALQHRAVDLWVQKELARAAVASAARTLDDASASPRARSAAASGAKARATHAALLMATQAVQLHGAIGFTDEYDLGLYLNRALVLSAWLGNAAEHRRRYGELAAIETDHAGETA